MTPLPINCCLRGDNFWGVSNSEIIEEILSGEIAQREDIGVEASHFLKTSRHHSHCNDTATTLHAFPLLFVLKPKVLHHHYHCHCILPRLASTLWKFDCNDRLGQVYFPTRFKVARSSSTEVAWWCRFPSLTRRGIRTDLRLTSRFIRKKLELEQNLFAKFENARETFPDVRSQDCQKRICQTKQASCLLNLAA